MPFFVKNIIIKNIAPLESLELEFEDKNIVLLTAINGGGKTTVLSLITDSFYEIAKLGFYHEFEGRSNFYYRVSSSLYKLNESLPSFAYVRFKNIEAGKPEENVDYLYFLGDFTKAEYENVIPLTNKIDYERFSDLIQRQKYGKILSDNLNRESANKIFYNNILSFFPSYRFEYPSYLTDLYKQRIKYDTEMHYNGYLPYEIENVTTLNEFANWIMDVLIDWKVYQETQYIPCPDGTIKNIDITPEKSNFDILNRIISNIVANDEGGNLRLGFAKRSNSAKRIAIMRDTNNGSFTKSPSIFTLSTGELSALTLFGNILRQADKIQFSNLISGVVLVDEIDTHLHIKLQKEVLPNLFGIFPNVQFIISSHSPFVAMGLNENESARNRFSPVHITKKGGLKLPVFSNPLYEEIYGMMINENNNFKRLYETTISTNKTNLLLVEDTYDQVYKIAWLKLKNIPFSKENFKEEFEKNSPFEIINDLSASGVAGCLRVRNCELFKGKKIIGLFDFDKEGSEDFYNLREGFSKKEDIEGNLENGFFKVKNTNTNCKMFGLLLPVPNRLKYLIGNANSDNLWNGDGKFSNFVEIENILCEDFQKRSSSFSKKSVFGNEYYGVKDTKKNTLWKELIDEPTNTFEDFESVFKAIYKLFDIEW